jgi:hypothetical protein
MHRYVPVRLTDWAEAAVAKHAAATPKAKDISLIRVTPSTCMKMNPINRVTNNRWPKPFVPLFRKVPACRRRMEQALDASDVKA